MAEVSYMVYMADKDVHAFKSCIDICLPIIAAAYNHSNKSRLKSLFPSIALE